MAKLDEQRTCPECDTALDRDRFRCCLWDCGQCGVTFEDRYWNGSMTPYVCEGCGINLKNAKVVMQHVKHTPDDNPEYRVVKTCEECHLRSEGPVAEPAGCTRCGTPFAYHGQAVEHRCAPAEGPQRPICGGMPMRTTDMGATPALPAYLCNKCDRYQQGDERTDGPYWSSHPSGGSQWSVASDRARYRWERRRDAERATSDPLDVEYDGVKLRLLLEQDEMRQRTERRLSEFEPLSPAQRAAVSAHWSAQLRAKVAASAAAELARRPSVVVDMENE